MKYVLLFATLVGGVAIALPTSAQFSSFSTGVDSCSSICVKLDLGSATGDNFGGGFNGGFNSGSPTTPNNLRWQLGITWRPQPPEFTQAEGERTKQRLEDNRSLMLTLADAIAQNKTELARGIAILLAPRLGYKDPRVLIAEMKEGSMNIGAAKVEIKPVVPNINSPSSPSIDPSRQPPVLNSPPPIELR
jgi:hypothetical protein